MTESHSVRKKKQPTYQVKINLLAKHFLVDAYKVYKILAQNTALN
jgi:hypothetical protein